MVILRCTLMITSTDFNKDKIKIIMNKRSLIYTSFVLCGLALLSFTLGLIYHSLNNIICGWVFFTIQLVCMVLAQKSKD